MTMKTIADLMKDRAVQWGLRGDPLLWDELERVFIDTPLPPTPDKMQAILETAFKSLTESDLHTASDHLLIARYKRENGGMSDGHITPGFWRTKAFPLIMRRYNAEMAPNDAI